MHFVSKFCSVVLVLSSFHVFTQEPTEEQIKEAVRKGADYLRRNAASSATSGLFILGNDFQLHDLVLYALVSVGMDEGDPVIADLAKDVIRLTPKKTYVASLQICALSKLNRDKYLFRIVQAAQFLVDNQCENGQWSYGTPTEQKIKDGQEIKKDDLVVKQKRMGLKEGDNSNTQFAMLGLFVAEKCGVKIENEILKKTAKFYEDSQNKDGGFGYQGPEPSSGSMTCGSLMGISAVNRMMKKSKSNALTQKAYAWICKNYSVTKNPMNDPDTKHLYYYLYSMERACALYELEKIDKADWYHDGAKFLLSQQQKDGNWPDNNMHEGDLTTTCFALLFLSKATKTFLKEKFIDTEPGNKKKDGK